ncbi:multiple epidermal growth factor-like domains protein 10 [Mercenaria mercenaria]|uniref:multiple epidermal growth factor-like domains protein 10 n=1 Tax=Mercenaria mercenaria TaxID=6596 RepID=UPI00234E832A|nr:multiple epidermal growth factor-like domains protein 10 [Mercenaria mercenaria]
MIELVGFVVVLLGTVSRAENITCSSECSDETGTCNHTTGECLHGCKDGFAGPDCSFECPANCNFSSENETGTCNHTTGECLHGCKDGFAGTSCSVECPQNCAPSDDRENEICNATSEDCVYGCKDGFYGRNCTNKCSDQVPYCMRCSAKDGNSGFVCNECSRNFYRVNGRCYGCNYFCIIKPGQPLPTCRERDGYCNFGCRPGRYGFICGRKCSPTCNDICQRETGSCIGGCGYPSYCGPTCEIECQDGCKLQQCNQSCDCVNGCNHYYWGNKCPNLCSGSCKVPADDSAICDSIDGTCLHGCKDTKHWGNKCISCSDGCLNITCEQKSGDCTEGCTKKTVYGGQCKVVCSDNCLNGTCERADGYCNDCIEGNYGIQCENACHVNCINSTCDRVNGSCVYGCKTGTYGEKCNKDCSDKCFDLKCERVDGNCTDGCVSGYQGFHCLTEDGQKKENAAVKCTVETDKTGLIVGICFGILSAVLTVYSTFITIALKRKTSNTGTLSKEESTKQATYINVAEEGSSRNDSGSSGNKDNSIELYTDLARSSLDDKTTYDVIQRI